MTSLPHPIVIHSEPADSTPPRSATCIDLADEAATIAAGTRLGHALRPGMVIGLIGELGAGKTTLVRGALRALGWTGSVKSPTYTLVEHYLLSRLYFYHFDFYRVVDQAEWDTAGFAEYFGHETVCLVEWPERMAGRLPTLDLEIQLAYVQRDGINAREATLRAITQPGARCLNAIVSPPASSASP